MTGSQTPYVHIASAQAAFGPELFYSMPQEFMEYLGERAVNPVEYIRRERIYWVCFIQERILAIEGSTPVCLDPLPSLPDVAGLPQSMVERG